MPIEIITELMWIVPTQRLSCTSSLVRPSVIHNPNLRERVKESHGKPAVCRLQTLGLNKQKYPTKNKQMHACCIVDSIKPRNMQNDSSNSKDVKHEHMSKKRQIPDKRNE